MEVSQREYRRSRLAALCLVLSSSFLWRCSINDPAFGEVDGVESRDQEQADQVVSTLAADVVSLEVTGGPNAYTFSVEIASPDKGCHQYVDWWEVLTEEGDLVYRRILTHSHVDEQPFVRSGGPVAIDSDTVVVVRAHMHPGGYGGTAMMGTVNTGFEEIPFDPDFALEVEDEPPQPTGCAF
ncbi:MAG TPA: hypothetical protein G4O14_03855 [Anaerolineae bacterium]|nr:hypothetical protein [Anaerolineae bacterium]